MIRTISVFSLLMVSIAILYGSVSARNTFSYEYICPVDSTLVSHNDTSSVSMESADTLAIISNAWNLLKKAEVLRLNYEFNKSADICRQIPDNLPDSSVISAKADALAMAENGILMSGFVNTPKIVARKMLALRDFFLYYPLDDKSWYKTPNILDSIGVSPAIYAPLKDSHIYYSATGRNGTATIMTVNKTDSTWTQPTEAGTELLSNGNEIFPMLSYDGNSLYFSSDGFYGVGGYDIYVSSKDTLTGTWKRPVNLGFPYSSPSNDYLLISTSDGLHTIFASDRDCPKDSVNVYVLEYDAVPVRQEITSTEELRSLSALEPPVAKENKENLMPENAEIQKYMSQIAVVKTLRDSVYRCGKELEEKRSQFADSDDNEERERLTSDIFRMEKDMPVLRDSLDAASAVLREIEMEFLFNGVILDPDKIQQDADKETPDVTHDFDFIRKEYGDTLMIEFEPLLPKEDLKEVINTK